MKIETINDIHKTKLMDEDMAQRQVIELYNRCVELEAALQPSSEQRQLIVKLRKQLDDAKKEIKRLQAENRKLRGLLAEYEEKIRHFRIDSGNQQKPEHVVRSHGIQERK